MWAYRGGMSALPWRRPEHLRRKILALVVLAAVGVGAVAVSVGAIGAQPAAANDYLTTQAAIGDVTDEVAATGRS